MFKSYVQIVPSCIEYTLNYVYILEVSVTKGNC